MAQITERPLPFKKNSNNNNFVSKAAGNNQTQASLTLPFWDDFSQAGFSPNPTLWLSGEHVRISSSIAKSAPTLNVAVFDGVDASGRPYNATSLLNGATDSLVSQMIDLSTLTADQVDSVYISFFWQATGNGEMPDRQDSLVLQFKKPDGIWQSAWRQIGGLDNQSEEFNQVVLKVNPEFFYDGFQFRFKSFTRLAGAFDTWLVDYIYLNDGRHQNDVAHVDRALTRRPSFLIAPYSAMPTEQFFADPAKYLSETNTEFYNLNDFFQPIQFTTTVKDLGTGNQLEVLNNESVANPPPGPYARRTFTSPTLSVANIDVDADSLWLETTYYIKSGDNFYIENISATNDTTFNTNLDYRVNDTVRVITKIDDFFAYDDNEADFAAGINQNGGKLAYEFFAEERALLTHIDINFPFTQQAGEPIELFVWTNIEEEARSEEILFQDSYSVLRPASIGAMTTYELDTPIFVQGTFFIGFQQATNEFLAVGLDKNQDSGDKMFYNVDGTWRKNENVKGSFLMRPRFDKTVASTFVPGKVAPEVQLDVYPNPSEGEFNIRGQVEALQLFDSWGKEAQFTVEETQTGLKVLFGKNQKGIYLLHVKKEGKIITKRLILNH
ncbi:T9SS type A sorting domain-containing protein [uncultured Roseivirga sp.]|uniref:T9SS type A sorting domain-containing protein n=1 Tax=uncultured Roseivirga sp. TaxID=543088 RepID=UPI0030DA6274